MVFPLDGGRSEKRVRHRPGSSRLEGVRRYCRRSSDEVQKFRRFPLWRLVRSYVAYPCEGLAEKGCGRYRVHPEKGKGNDRLGTPEPCCKTATYVLGTCRGECGT